MGALVISLLGPSLTMICEDQLNYINEQLLQQLPKNLVPTHSPMMFARDARVLTRTQIVSFFGFCHPAIAIQVIDRNVGNLEVMR